MGRGFGKDAISGNRMKRSRDASRSHNKSKGGIPHPMDELGAIEEEEVIGLNANDSLLIQEEESKQKVPLTRS